MQRAVVRGQHAGACAGITVLSFFLARRLQQRRLGRGGHGTRGGVAIASALGLAAGLCAGVAKELGDLWGLWYGTPSYKDAVADLIGALLGLALALALLLCSTGRKRAKRQPSGPQHSTDLPC